MAKTLKMKKAIRLRMKGKPAREGCFVLMTAPFSVLYLFSPINGRNRFLHWKAIFMDQRGLNSSVQPHLCPLKHHPGPKTPMSASLDCSAMLLVSSHVPALPSLAMGPEKPGLNCRLMSRLGPVHLCLTLGLLTGFHPGPDPWADIPACPQLIPFHKHQWDADIKTSLFWKLTGISHIWKR